MQEERRRIDHHRRWDRDPGQYSCSLVNCTGETKRRNSSTARPAQLQSSISQSLISRFCSNSKTDPLMRCVVVSCPANNSRKTIDTISSRLSRLPSFSTQTSSEDTWHPHFTPATSPLSLRIVN